MSMGHLPEGRLLRTAENQAALSSPAALDQARQQETIVEGRALLCTPGHDLVVQLGPFTGRIPREEAALGIREGTAREIAILSRVGKPVACTVLGWEGKAPLLSRRRAQALALAALLETPVGTVLPATVTHLEPFGAFVDVGCGVVSFVSVRDLSVSRIPHPSSRVRVGQAIYVLLTGTDRALGRVYLSHKELLGTWAENAAPFAPGMTVPAVLRSIQPYGAFWELTPNLSGLSDQVQGLEEGDRAAVFIKAIQPDRRKIKLTVLEPLEPDPDPAPLAYRVTAGQLTDWDYGAPLRPGP